MQSFEINYSECNRRGCYDFKSFRDDLKLSTDIKLNKDLKSVTVNVTDTVVMILKAVMAFKLSTDIKLNIE